MLVEKGGGYLATLPPSSSEMYFMSSYALTPCFCFWKVAQIAKLILKIPC